jgi:hypothetical protein
LLASSDGALGDVIEQKTFSEQMFTYVHIGQIRKCFRDNGI